MLRIENIVSPTACDSHTYSKRDVKQAGLAAVYVTTVYMLELFEQNTREKCTVTTV